MPPRSPNQPQGPGDSVWRLMVALIRACDLATDAERQASPLWLSAVADVADNLLTELNSTGTEVQVVADTAAAASPVSPLRPHAHDHHGLGRALDSATAELEELVLQEQVAWTKRRKAGSDDGGAGAPSSPAADVEALMVRTLRILARCRELKLLGPEDRPSARLRVLMRTALRRVVGRCTITTVEFRRTIHAFKNGVFEIRLGSRAAGATFRVNLDAIWPAPSDPQRSGFRTCLLATVRNAPDSGSALRLRCLTYDVPGEQANRPLVFARLRDAKRHATLADDKQVQPSHGRWSRRKGITRDALSKVLREWVSKGLHHECSKQVIYSNICGREDIQEGITKQLLSNDNNSKFTVICLAARRGLGKTTLVNSVYNEQRVSDAFDLRLWVSLSEKFDEKTIMTSIIEHATQVQCDVMELKLLRQLAKDELNERKFLLVLDDYFYIQHYGFWRIIHGIMGFGAKGSAMIITTKNEHITHPRCIPLHIYRLSPLSDGQCLQILQQYTFGANHDPSSTHIIHNCGGNPLYLKAIIGLLCHAESALQQLKNLEAALFPDIKLCCDLLPQHLKLSLSFCSLFPRDYLFTRHHLTRLWMSLGFVNHDELGSPEEICTRYFEELFCRSFFEHSPPHENKETFVIPKSFHDMVTSISKDTCLRSKDLLCSIPEKIRQLSVVPLDRRAVVALHPVTKQVESLNAFLVVNRSELQNNSMSLPSLKLEGLDDFLLKFKSIRTLNLSYTVIGHLPASVGNLKNLQYLAVNNTDIRRLPLELCWLKNLHTLEVRNCPQLVTLPKDTANLTKLRHLDVRKHTGYVKMPFGVGELINLQTLPTYNVGRDLSDCSITKLRDLDNLHGELTITGLENVKAGTDAREAKLINKKHLKTLTLQWSNNNIYLEDNDEEDPADVFQSLQPPNDLENLIVRNYSGSLFPIWIEKSPYEKLQSIILDSCYNCCILPSLGDLQSLRHLCLRRMYTPKTFGCTSLSEERNGGKFPALELLKLWEMYELEGWIGVKDGDFPRLHTVSICGCPALKSLPCLPSLLDLSLRRCNQLPEIPELVRLKSLKIEGFQEMVSLDLPQGLPALKNLEIIHCNKLASLVGLSTLPSVERLKIVKCPNLDVVNNWQQYHFKKIRTSRDATVIST